MALNKVETTYVAVLSQLYGTNMLEYTVRRASQLVHIWSTRTETIELSDVVAFLTRYFLDEKFTITASRQQLDNMLRLNKVVSMTPTSGYVKPCTALAAYIFSMLSTGVNYSYILDEKLTPEQRNAFVHMLQHAMNVESVEDGAIRVMLECARSEALKEFGFEVGFIMADLWLMSSGTGCLYIDDQAMQEFKDILEEWYENDYEYGNDDYSIDSDYSAGLIQRIKDKFVYHIQ